MGSTELLILIAREDGLRSTFLHYFFFFDFLGLLTLQSRYYFLGLGILYCIVSLEKAYLLRSCMLAGEFDAWPKSISVSNVISQAVPERNVRAEYQPYRRSSVQKGEFNQPPGNVKSIGQAEVLALVDNMILLKLIRRPIAKLWELQLGSTELADAARKPVLDG